MLTACHPKLPMRNKAATQDFYVTALGFQDGSSADYEAYLILRRDGIELHFFLFEGLDPLENYGQVYIRTDAIDVLYDEFSGWIHPAAPLQTKPWGLREFAVLDPDHNLLTFGQSL